MPIRPYPPNQRQSLEDAIEDFARGEFRLGTGQLSSAYFGSGQRYPVDREWVRTWGALGELLLPLARAARDLDKLTAGERAGLASQSLEFAGGARVCREWFDEFVTGASDPKETGRRVLESVLRAAARAVKEAQGDVAVVANAIGRSLTPNEATAATQLLEDFGRGVVAPVSDLIGEGTALGSSLMLSADDFKRTWLGIAPRIPLEPIPAIIYLSRSIGQQVFPNAPQTVVQPGEDFFASLSDPRSGLPPLLAAKFSAGDRLMTHKAYVEREAGYFDSGIEPPGTTELDRRGFPYVFGEGNRKSVVVLAPTSGGKSRFGQLALIHTIAQQKRRFKEGFGRVVVLAPTKALVDQVARELRDTLADTEGASWSVLEGSRDYPQNDEAIRTCRFDIAVAIPEKLAALVRAGMSTARVPLILVDELQHIVDGHRGLKLESLLLDVFSRDRVPRFVGLSASLAPESVELLKAWFEKNGLTVDFLQIASRPVPLTVSVVDEWRRIVSRTHIRDDRATVQRKLPTIPEALGTAGIRRTAREFRRTLALLMEILAPHVAGREFRDEVPSVLVFVRSKRIAEELVEICRELLVRHLGVKPVASSSVNEGQHSLRFAPFVGSDADIDPTNVLRLLAPTPVRQQLADAIHSGVAFHSASLTAVGREVVEDLFRRGVIRVLFATDTLRLGINLPADIVVNGDLLVYIGRDSGPRLVEKDALLQRLGRAGRLLHSRGLGVGYLVTPEHIDDNARDQIDERIAAMLTGHKDAKWEEIKKAATRDDALYKAYVADWSGGAHYMPPADEQWFEELLLQYFEYSPGRALSSESVVADSAALFSRTLAGVSGAAVPSNAVHELQKIGAIRPLAGALRLTDAGRAAAMNALGVGDLPVIQEIASEAIGGAGPLSLLYAACHSEFVAKSLQDLRVRPRANPDVLEKMIQNIVRVRAASASPERRNRDTFMRHFGLDVEDCVGHGGLADEVSSLLSVDSATGATEAELTALWRAFNLYLRVAGSTYMNIASQPNPSGARIPEVSLDRLAANTAYFLAAASDLLGSNPTTMHFRTLSYFAGEVELGVPTALAPLVHLNRPSINRERVLGISQLLGSDGLRWDGLADLFRLYVDESDGIPRVKDGWHPLPASEIAWVTEQLEAIDRRRTSAAYSVAANVESMVVPGLDGQRVADVLRQIPQGRGPQLIAAMLEPFGVRPEVDLEERSIRIDYPFGDGTVQTTNFRFPNHIVENAFIDEVVGDLGEHENAIIVAVEGATYGAVNRGQFLEDPCTIVDPSLLVEMLARLYTRNATAPTVSPTDDLLDELFGTAALPGIDTQAAQSELSRVLLYNAPVLSRTDLENRLAFIDLAPAD